MSALRTIPLVLFFTVIGCASFGSVEIEPMKMYTEESKMLAEVERKITISMPIEEAKLAMEKCGFKCVFERVSSTHTASGENEENGQFCLICSKYTPESNWIASDLITVYILFETGAVKKIVVHHIPCCL